MKICLFLIHLLLKNINEITQSTLIAGPGERLKIIANKKPRTDIIRPYIDDLTIPTQRLLAL
tara:strand:+ start:1607 stop:1792 length:186 start_codon:yes stop_codon:yes gene_type:complete